MAAPNIFRSLTSPGEPSSLSIAGINPIALLKVVVGDLVVVNLAGTVMDYIFPKFDPDDSFVMHFVEAVGQLFFLIGTVAEVRMNLSWIYDDDPTGALLIPAILIVNSVDLRKKLAAISAASLAMFKGLLNDYSLEDVANEVQGLVPDEIKNELHALTPKDPNNHHKKSKTHATSKQ